MLQQAPLVSDTKIFLSININILILYSELRSMTLRTTRAGTRNLVKEEIKRVKKQLEKVRKWEKKWVVLGDGGLRVYRWVPKKVSEVNLIGAGSRSLFFKSDEQETQKTSPLKAILKQQMAEKAAVQAGTGTKEEIVAKEEPLSDAKPQVNNSSEESSAVRDKLTPEHTKFSP